MVSRLGNALPQCGPAAKDRTASGALTSARVASGPVIPVGVELRGAPSFARHPTTLRRAGQSALGVARFPQASVEEARGTGAW
jgi:hypothetical protein